MSQEDYYKILGVARGSSDDEIKKAYRKLAMEHHPDRNKDNLVAEKKFKEINQAYDTLKDSKKRAAYDQFGHAGASGSAHGGFGKSQGFQGFDFDMDVENIFDMFGFGGSGKSKKPKKERGADLQYNLAISLEEAFQGVEKTISFVCNDKCDVCNGLGSKTGSVATCSTCGGRGSVYMQQGFFSIERACASCQGSGQIVKDPCKSCNGQGVRQKNKKVDITVPTGVVNGMRLRKIGQGSAGYRGGDFGDLYILISIKTHPIFKVDEKANMHCKLPISFISLTLGAKIEVQDIQGEKIPISISPGTENGEQIVIKNKGMHITGLKNRGNLVVHLVASVPKNLTPKQKELFEALNKELEENKSSESILEKMKNLWR